MAEQATLAGGTVHYAFPFNPDNVQWGYKENTAVYETLGGRVIQLCSVEVSSLTVQGQAGSKLGLQRMATSIYELMKYHVASQRPAIFRVPSRRWEFMVYVVDMPRIGYDVQTVAFPFELRLEVEEDLGITSAWILNHELDNLALGVGDNPEWHGGNADNAQQIVSTIIANSGSSEVGGGGIGAGGGGSHIGNLTQACVAFEKDVTTQFKDLIFMGDYVVKKIEGTQEWSQHSYGNAVDYGHTGSPNSLYPLWNYVLANTGRLNIAHAIFNHKIWDYKTGRVGDYNGINPHTNHVHTDYIPQWCGDPPGHVCS